jgi:cytoplasmic iron level regulating protein YaaA (DUF328/UPF0246 family)
VERIYTKGGKNLYQRWKEFILKVERIYTKGGRNLYQRWKEFIPTLYELGESLSFGCYNIK